MAKKATKDQIAARKKRIAELQAACKTRAEICKIIAKEERISPRTVETTFDHYSKERAAAFKGKEEEILTMLFEVGRWGVQKAQEQERVKDAIDAGKFIKAVTGVGEKQEQGTRMPEIIKIGVKDFSGPTGVVKDDKAENE